jgi:hypothetical protein
MSIIDVLHDRFIFHCPECNCAIGDDWEYVDFSNKSIIECSQCKNRIYLEEVDDE